jgi:hypothetical protein
MMNYEMEPVALLLPNPKGYDEPRKLEAHWLLLRMPLFHWLGANENIPFSPLKRSRFTK